MRSEEWFLLHGDWPGALSGCQGGDRMEEVDGLGGGGHSALYFSYFFGLYGKFEQFLKTINRLKRVFAPKTNNLSIFPEK